MSMLIICTSETFIDTSVKLNHIVTPSEGKTQDGVDQFVPQSSEIVNLTRCWLGPFCSDQVTNKVSPPTHVMVGLNTVFDSTEPSD